ncbi:MAG: phosphohistidine phosphatase [Myxococcota bacterium]|jgi:phosphohistidine phosphatase
MELYIVRHGDALATSPDAARTLSSVGRVEVQTIARAMSTRGVRVRQIRHSGRVRARETAELLGAALEPPAGVIQIDGLHPEDPIEPVANSLFGERESLMLVGHLPFVGRLVGLLTTGDAHRSPISFPTATVACLQGEDDQWELAWVEHP